MAAKSEAQPRLGVSSFDPICGRTVAPRAPLSFQYKRRVYYFCSDGCRCAFEAKALKFRMAERARAGVLMTTGKLRWGMA